jgi:hypothetical protein
MDSIEGVKMAANAQVISEREQGPRQEVGTSESKGRMNRKASKYKSEVQLYEYLTNDISNPGSKLYV